MKTEVIASGLLPTVNHQIKEATTDKEGNVNSALNLTAHALWGAVEAYEKLKEEQLKIFVDALGIEADFTLVVGDIKSFAEGR